MDLLGFRAGSKEKMVAKTDPARKADGSGGWKWSRCFGWRRARLCLVLLLRDQQALDGLAVDRTSLETDIFCDKENIYEYDRHVFLHAAPSHINEGKPVESSDIFDLFTHTHIYDVKIETI